MPSVHDRAVGILMWWLAPVSLVLWLLGGRETAARPYCWLLGHQPAWETPGYPPAPNCVCCGVVVDS